MSDEDERTVVKTYLPRSQKEAWVEHAEALDMSQSEFLRTMVQAGRRGFDPTTEETDSRATTPGGEGLEDRVLGELSESGVLGWEELVGRLTDDIERDIDDALGTLQDERAIRYSGRHGGYVVMGEDFQPAERRTTGDDRARRPRRGDAAQRGGTANTPRTSERHRPRERVEELPSDSPERRPPADERRRGPPQQNQRDQPGQNDPSEEYDRQSRPGRRPRGERRRRDIASQRDAGREEPHPQEPRRDANREQPPTDRRPVEERPNQPRDAPGPSVDELREVRESLGPADDGEWDDRVFRGGGRIEDDDVRYDRDRDDEERGDEY